MALVMLDSYFLLKPLDVCSLWNDIKEIRELAKAGEDGEF